MPYSNVNSVLEVKGEDTQNVVVGQNIAGTMDGMLAGVNQPISGTAPPPTPAAAYHVAINGQATGPYDLQQLQ